MRLGIDAREIENGVVTGIGRPLFNFLQFFNTLDTTDECVLLSVKPLPFTFGPRIRNKVIPQQNVFIWDQLKLRRAIREFGIEIFYSPYYKIPFLAPVPVISALLDVMYLCFDPYYDEMPLSKKMYYTIVGRMMAHRSFKILTCSFHSKNDVMRLYGIHEKKITVIPLSLGDIYKPVDDATQLRDVKLKFGIKGKYLLYVGNFKPHKNIARLIRAFKKIAGEFPQLQLVCAGPHEFEYPRLAALCKELDVGDRVIFSGTIKEQDHPQALYSGAEVFVFPSLYEGFGLPPLEAIACRTAVVASSTTSIPEVVRDAGLLVNPENIDDIADGMRQVLTNTSLRERLVSKGEKIAREYSSDAVNRQLYSFFKTAYQESLA